MCVNIEDAGFEIRDLIAWMYGSGFPKSLDVSKSIDKAAEAKRDVVGNYTVTGTAAKGKHKERAAASADEGSAINCTKKLNITAPAAARQWDGWGTALKPAMEPITVARKPLVGTVAANVLAHGTGAINVDGCRVEGAKPDTTRECGERDGWGMQAQGRIADDGKGRWPANVIHDGSDEVLAAFPNAPGQLAPLKFDYEDRKTGNVYGVMKRGHEPSANSNNNGPVGFKMKPGDRRLDSGNASRFFYCAKASRHDRDEGVAGVAGVVALRDRGRQSLPRRNHHPTVKPTDLMRYLCRLVTQPGGTILDPYMGSGSTGKAAMLEGFRFIGIEREADYVEIARDRIAAAHAARPLLNAENN
jgi:site-specific DNA-methyltransferase (adenine-specific)